MSLYLSETVFKSKIGWNWPSQNQQKRAKIAKSPKILKFQLWIDRRQTINILLRHVRLLWLLVTCWKFTIFVKSKFRKIFLDFFGVFFNRYIFVLHILSIGAFYVSTPFRNRFQIQNRMKFTFSKSQLKYLFLFYIKKNTKKIRKKIFFFLEISNFQRWYVFSM